MALTGDEIKQIAKATAQEVVNTLHRYTVVYQEPETIQQGLSESVGEELTAEDWYRKRAENARSKGDFETARLYNHIADEEFNHHREFNKRLEEISK